MANLAADRLNVDPALATLDAPGPNSRGFQSAYRMLQEVNSFLFKVTTPGATNYLLSEEWAEADRTSYESAVDALKSAIKDANLAAKAVLKLS